MTRLGNTSLTVTVDVFVEHLFDKDRLHAVTGRLTMVAIGEDKRPVPIVV